MLVNALPLKASDDDDEEWDDEEDWDDEEEETEE